MSKQSFLSILSLLCLSYICLGCQAFIKDKALIEQIAEDVVSVEIDGIITKK